MRILFEIMRFELRQQCRTPFVWAGWLVSFLIHFLTIGSIGISLWAHPQAYINTTYGVAVVTSTLTIVSLLPMIVFVADAVLRDHDHAIAALIFVKPISHRQYLGGRFCAVAILAAFMGLAAISGALLGTLMPWVEPARVASLSLGPFAFNYCCIVLPNLLILCALFFSVAILMRSFPLTVAVAVVLIAFDLLLAGFKLNTDADPGLLALADHAATLVISEASRNLSVTELNALHPGSLLLANRLLWLVVSFAMLAFSFNRFSFSTNAGWTMQWPKRLRLVFQPARKAPPKLTTSLQPVSGNKYWAPVRSQLRMDLAAILLNPLFWIILVAVISATFTDYNDHVSPVMKSALYPITSARLDFFRYGLLSLVILIAIYFSGTLVHRERAHNIAELVGASPVQHWVLPVSKVFALCAAITLVLLVAMLTAMSRQLMAGAASLEVGLYLRVVFLHNGFYYCMLCILAVFIQIVVPNKWLGMLLTLTLYIFLFNLNAFGFEHILYQYTIPAIPYSDMNGFGRAGQQVYSLIGYWAFFCALLVLVGCLMYPGGTDVRFRKRLFTAKASINKVTVIAALLLLSGCCITGSWIFYNTNVLHKYQTTYEQQQIKADYERLYGRYEACPLPTFSSIDIAVDLFPSQQRLESRGSATLTNNKKTPINEFVISLDPRLKIHDLSIRNTTLLKADTVMGFYLFKPDNRLLPGATLTMHWQVSEANKGFANANEEIELVENGTYITNFNAMPIPGFDDTRLLTDNTTRKKFGLPKAKGLPTLGDTNYLDKIQYGVDSRANFHIVVSTSVDQQALAPGKLAREWQQNNRHYFEYVSEKPLWPKLYFLSARYKVARQTWSNYKQQVDLEIYYDSMHHYNVAAMLSSASRSLNYLTGEFAPYPYSYFRIMEYPRYRKAAQALPGGGVAYSEGVGFVANLDNLQGIDYTTVHELSHKWWGEQAYGAKMQGREMLNETLAQYSMLMIFKQYDQQHPGAYLVNRIIADLQTNYLQARNKDSKPERPLLYTDGQGYVSYNKGALALYALQELIGEKNVNRALQHYLTKFAFQPAPYPTARDLVNELRAVAGAAYQHVITDWFEKVISYDVAITEALIKKEGDSYTLSVTVNARQFETDSTGNVTEIPGQAWFDVGLFPDGKRNAAQQVPSYLGKYLLKSGVNTVVLKTNRKPVYVSIDPFRKMPDKEPANNGRAIDDR